jgi:transcription termination factor NusA
VEDFNERVGKAAKTLSGPLQIDEATAVALVKGGLSTLEMIAEVEPQDIADAISVPPEKAAEIHAAAKRAMAPTQ